MTRMRRLGLVLLGAGCLAALPEPAAGQKRQRDLITAEEIQASPHKYNDLYQLVRGLRPHFLAPPRGVRTLGGGSIAPVALYVDDVRRSGLDELKLIKPEDVHEVRYLDPSKAQELYGITHSGGAVIVKLKGRVH